MLKGTLDTDISNTSVEEEMRFSKILGIRCQAIITKEREREREVGWIRTSNETSREST
jgi:hypothetical protein